MTAFMAHTSKSSSTPSFLSFHDATVERAVKEVVIFKQIPPLPLVEDGHNCQEIIPDPRKWCVSRAHDFDRLAPLARRLLAIPALQAELERLFSSRTP